MALNKAGLAAALTVVFSDLSGKTPAQKATEVADAIDAYVRTGTVTTVLAVASATALTPASPGTGTGTGAIT